MKRWLPVVLLLTLAGCAGSRDAEVPAVDLAVPVTACEAIPARAFTILDEGRADGCSICEETAQRKAFRLLDAAFPPGRILLGGPDCPLVRVIGPDPELAVAGLPSGAGGVTFRIHTAEDHLVGIAETDFSPNGSLPAAGSRFDGALQVVAYAYGDGAAFLYSPNANHVQVQCRVVPRPAR